MIVFRRWLPAAALILLPSFTFAADSPTKADPADPEWLIPNEKLMKPFAERVPIVFVTRGTNRREWEQLPKFWNDATQELPDPVTQKPVTQKVVKIKVPLGINLAPPVPPENPMTRDRWELGKRLFFDTIISSNATIACANCHSPKFGYTDGSKVSIGINGLKGGVSAPTVLNAAFNRQHFWDGRAASLEDQAQGPPQNSVEMFDGKGNAWHEGVRRIRNRADYVKLFQQEFGTLPTRDAIAKAIATYERTVLVGNSIHDRAEVAMRKRVEDEEGTKFEIQSKDYEAVLKDAFAKNDSHALTTLKLDTDKDHGRIAEVAGSIDRGRTLYFNKARCNLCHVGESFTDLGYHNLGVGAKDGKLPPDLLGRAGALPTGAKDPTLIGAFKTPPLRGLLSTAPYLHDGSEDSLEKVVDFYDRGGNVNEFLDPKMRNVEAELAWMREGGKTSWKGPKVELITRDGRPIIPFRLSLTADEKKDLVMFLRALESDPVDPTVADPNWFPRGK